MPHPEQNEYLFVYGSLQRKASHPAHNVLREHAQFICNAEFDGVLYMVKEYPGVIKASQPEKPVKGELFLLNKPKKIFRKLDQYEGYDPDNPGQSLYVREKCAVRCPGTAQEVAEAWIYLFNRPTHQLERISSGDYLTHIGKS